MKSEERHRLQETELEKLGRNAQEFWESFAKDYAKPVLIGIAAVALIAGGVFWWINHSAAQDAERWNAVLSASFDSDPAKSIEQFAETADRHSDHPAGQWAALMEAERALSQGIQTSRTNRKTSVSELLQAREAYTQLANAKSDLIQERRLFGMARTLETLAGVDVSGEKDAEGVDGVEDAIGAYELFLQQFPDSIFASLAENRIAALKTDRAQDFYAWYREQAPNPEDFEKPTDGTSPGQLPPGHPPLSPGQPPMTPPTSPAAPVTDESVMQELENLVKGKPDQETAPDLPLPEEPKGPTLTPPKTEEAKPNTPATPMTEEKKPETPAAPKTEEAKPETPTAPKTEEAKPEVPKADENKPEPPSPPKADDNKPAPKAEAQPQEGENNE